MEKLIYIAEDEKHIRDLEMIFLQKSGFKVNVFGDGGDLLQAFARQPCDLVILDIMMPKMDGLTVCTKMRETSTVPIIIVSAKDTELDRVTGITLGCDDYLVKPFSPIELVARVQAIFRRIEFEGAQKSVFECGNLLLDADRREVTIADAFLHLTNIEFDVLHYLLNNRSRAVSREELLCKVWDFSHDSVDTRATDDTIKRLRKKFHCRISRTSCGRPSCPYRVMRRGLSMMW